MKKPKYIAVKLIGFEHLLWFERSKTTEVGGTFVGREGWGEAGAFTNLECSIQAIEARIESDALQY